MGDDEGNVKAIEVVKTRLGEFDSSGRRKPVPTEEIQRYRMRHRDPGAWARPSIRISAALQAGIEGGGHHRLWTASRWKPAARNFYAGGDVITGASNVSNAMGYGKKAARNIDQRLMGEARWEKLMPDFDYQDATRGGQHCDRHHARCDLPAKERVQISGGSGDWHWPRKRHWKRPVAACAATFETHGASAE